MSARITQKKSRITEYMKASTNGEIALLNSMLINALSPGERDVLRWIGDHPGATASETGTRFGTTINSASNMLLTLTSVGLLRRTDAIPHRYYPVEKSKNGSQN